MGNVHIDNEDVKKLYLFLSRFARKAYTCPNLIANNVLGKNCVLLLDLYLRGKVASMPRAGFKLAKFARYLLKNLFLLARQILLALVFALKGERCRVSQGSALFLVDIFVITGSILRSGAFENSYLPGLAKILDSMKVDWAYVPRFHGLKTPLDLSRMLHIMRRDKIQALTEFQLLSPLDYLRLFTRILAYPLQLMRFLSTLDSSREAKLLARAIWEFFDQDVVTTFTREFMGRRLSRLPTSRLHVISWYENQIMDKLFFRGLRYGAPKSGQPISIYGAQLFIWASTMLSIHPDEAEAPFGTLPDVVVVNGPHYLKMGKHIQYRIGPSLRYSWLFDHPVRRKPDGHIVVLLSYFDYEIRNILETIGKLTKTNLLIKFHPTTNVEIYRNLLPSYCNISSSSVREALTNASMVVGAATGSLVEAASLGFPVIVLENPTVFGHNELPEYGRGIIWESAGDVVQLAEVIDRFEIALRDEPERLDGIAQEYMRMFFTRPDLKEGPGSLAEAFDLPGHERNPTSFVVPQ